MMINLIYNNGKVTFYFILLYVEFIIIYLTMQINNALTYGIKKVYR